MSGTEAADILSKLSAAGDETPQRRCYQPWELWKLFRGDEWLAPSDAPPEAREAFKADTYGGKRHQV